MLFLRSLPFFLFLFSAGGQDLPTLPQGTKKPATFKELQKLYAEQGVKLSHARLPKPEGVEVKKDLVYANRETGPLKVDLYLPKSDKPLPLVILVHGGGWKKGSKDKEDTRAHWLTARGYAVAAVQYRLSGEARYPAALYDVRDAIIWLRKNAEEYNYDPERFATIGGSAGAHLNALHAMAIKDPASKVHAAVIIAGPTNPTDEQAAKSSRDPASNYRLFLGKSIDEAPELYREISPFHQAHGGTPPCLMISENSPERDSLFVNKLKSLKVPVEHLTFPDTLHPSWHWEPWFTVTMERSHRFLQGHLKK
ncbi:alpha/beta hydrolase [Akkermansiaceae bacterium]|nr:alpha/beta hydrolase [Akkermansiaceae bacterium]